MTVHDITDLPKKSFFTRVMEDVEAKKAAKESDKTMSEQISEEPAAKRALVKFGLVVVGSVAAVTAAVVILNRMQNETSEEEEIVEDEN